jgi:pimeloyl-ACP methyl ester carboxylesterase
MTRDLDLFLGWAERRLRLGEVEMALCTAGAGPALLSRHGFPQTHGSWHKIVPKLARHCTLVVADLRGYGASSFPRDELGHVSYAKRRVHAICEDYRAGAGIDRQLDEADLQNGRKITCPTLGVGGSDYLGKRGADPLQVWRGWCSDLAGAEIDSGHFLAEENPEATVAAMLPFLAAHGGR